MQVLAEVLELNAISHERLKRPISELPRHFRPECGIEDGVVATVERVNRHVNHRRFLDDTALSQSRQEVITNSESSANLQNLNLNKTKTRLNSYVIVHVVSIV